MRSFEFADKERKCAFNEVSSEFAKKERQYTAQGNIAQFLYVFADSGRSCAAIGNILQLSLFAAKEICRS